MGREPEPTGRLRVPRWKCIQLWHSPSIGGVLAGAESGVARLRAGAFSCFRFTTVPCDAGVGTLTRSPSMKEPRLPLIAPVDPHPWPSFAVDAAAHSCPSAGTYPSRSLQHDDALHQGKSQLQKTVARLLAREASHNYVECIETTCKSEPCRIRGDCSRGENIFTDGFELVVQPSPSRRRLGRPL